MTRVYRINTSKVDGVGADNNDVGRLLALGEIGLYQNNNGKLELVLGDGDRTYIKSKVLNKGTFYGGDADSGDGAGLDTIKLVPDATLGSDQYIIVDPTAPNHIHIRAGGTIDNSGADLFLGGEENHVKVSDGGDTVTVRTSQSGEGVINRDWIFDNSGIVTFPDGTTQTTAWAGGRVVAVPTASTGAVNDMIGDIAFNSSYFYYCTANYTDGLSNIWKRVAWSADTW